MVDGRVALLALVWEGEVSFPDLKHTTTLVYLALPLSFYL